MDTTAFVSKHITTFLMIIIYLFIIHTVSSHMLLVQLMTGYAPHERFPIFIICYACYMWFEKELR